MKDIIYETENSIKCNHTYITLCIAYYEIFLRNTIFYLILVSDRDTPSMSAGHRFPLVSVVSLATG